MPQPMRPHVRSPVHLSQPRMYDSPNGPRIDATTPYPKEERSPRPGPNPQRPPVNAPPVHRPKSRQPKRHRPFLTPFAQNPDDVPVPIHIINVERTQLTHPYTGGVQQLKKGLISKFLGFPSRGHLQDGLRLLLSENSRQRPSRLRAAQQQPRIGRKPAAAVAVGGKGTNASGPPRQRGPSLAGPILPSQPLTKHPDIKAFQPPIHMIKQGVHVGQISPHRVLRKIPLNAQMPPELPHHFFTTDTLTHPRIPISGSLPLAVMPRQAGKSSLPHASPTRPRNKPHNHHGKNITSTLNREPGLDHIRPEISSTPTHRPRPPRPSHRLRTPTRRSIRLGLTTPGAPSRRTTLRGQLPSGSRPELSPPRVEPRQSPPRGQPVPGSPRLG